MNNIAIQFITMFGIGRISKIPGTLASFATCLFYFVCITLDINLNFLLIVFFLVLVFSVFLIDKYSSNFSEIDAKEIVIDEYLGQSIPVLFFYHSIQKADLESSWLFLFACFVLFRFFDILKPFPINLVDKRMKNGFGVVLDDLLAGIYVIFVCALLVFIFGPIIEVNL